MKVQVLAISLVLCLGLALSTEFKSHNKHTERSHKESRTETPGAKKSWPMKQEAIDKMAADNKAAEDIFQANKKGRDPADENSVILTVDFKEISDMATLSDTVANDKTPQKRQLMITKHALAILDEKNNGYRSIEYGMDLLDLIGPGDSETSGRCCSGISEVRETMFKFGAATVATKLQCFLLQGKLDTWQICDLNPITLTQTRTTILISVIKASLRSKGFYNVNVFLPKTGDMNNWTWRNQQEWPGSCSGKRQSPIDLDKGRAEMVDYLSVRFNWGRPTDATAKYDGHEMAIMGDFGKFYLRREIGASSYNCAKVTFKFPSEHTVMNPYGGEIQVHCSSSNGDGAIMSFFLLQIEGAANNNKFIENVKWERWRMDNQDPVNLIDEAEKVLTADQNGKIDYSKDKTPSLDYLIFQKRDAAADKDLGGTNNPDNWILTDIFRKSFYWYTGSTTTPPCKEGVQWFVFEQPIYIPNSQFMALKAKTFNMDTEDQGNARQTHPQNAMKVYFHMDNGVKCARYLASESSEETISDWSSTSTKENLSIDLSKIKKTWLRASNVLTTYGYTGAEVPDFEAWGMNKPDPKARQSIALSVVDPEKDNTAGFGMAKVKLLKEANKQMKETCKKTTTETFKEMREKYSSSEHAIKVPWFERRRRR